LSPTLNEQTPAEADTAAPGAAADPRGHRSGPQERLDAARRRLRAALEGLDAAVIRQAERAIEQADQTAEYSALQDDRSRLALEVDSALNRVRALEGANGEAARRIERAAAAVRAVLAADSGEEA
jgi:D-serine deaminase-like pyridoxal phosphate-dependent protein